MRLRQLDQSYLNNQPEHKITAIMMSGCIAISQIGITLMGLGT